MSNPFFTATSFSNYLLTDTYAFAQLGGSSGTIMFNDSYIVYFTVIGGGGGGGGGGHNNGLNSPAYPSGGSQLLLDFLVLTHAASQHLTWNCQLRKDIIQRLELAMPVLPPRSMTRNHHTACR